MFGRNTRCLALMFAALAIVIFSQSVGYSRVVAPPVNPPTGPTDTDGDTTGGIEIDAQGVLSQRIFQGNAQLLNRQRFAAAQASLNKDLQKPSKLRKISLTRLEKEVAKLVAQKKQIPADMKYLAGMTRISNVFYYPESKDIVIAGPAEGYFITADNRVVGMKTGRSTMQLQDLIVALRCFTPDGKKTKVMMDSGVRSGGDILRAKALGADFVFLGRPFVYGVAALGDKGGNHVYELLYHDMINNMHQLGITSLDEMKDVEEPTGCAKNDLERMFDLARNADSNADKIETPIDIKKETLQPKRIRRVQKDSPAEKSEQRRSREGLVKEALAQIAQGSSYSVVAKQSGLCRNLLAKRVKEQDTSNWVKNPGPGSKVMSKEEEWRFAESLRKQFNDSGKLLEWQTLKSLLQRHLQNLVQANPARLTGFEESNQKPTTGYTRRFDK